MSIANLVALSRCTKNIILIGDQMQLEQPIQGFHPEDSGMSTLEYYMGDLATIPDDQGVFLGTTYRMHPDVCSLISNAVYEGKLHSAPQTKDRVLALPPAELKYVTKNAGIIFVPVDHDGNNQDSEEEAQVICEIVAELQHCNIGLNQILIVAPYNAQVRRIRSLLPANARVGSVDKFQGQEAPVVILSMCSSDANASPRGLPFLFSRSRLNVAISRAETLAIIVASPRLGQANCTRVEHIALTNFFCRIMQCGRNAPDQSSGGLGYHDRLILDSQYALDGEL
jgi:superfamily I DNA and/or RNA helicase